MKIAVVGSGISGLSSAYYLSKKHKVDLFEKQDRFGGHSYTLDVQYTDKEKVAVDIGFMVFLAQVYGKKIEGKIFWIPVLTFMMFMKLRIKNIFP